MKQIIPFSKDIVFKTNIASITSISLEHTEKLDGGEISGEFIIFGDYKIHADTTASVSFKYRLPFTTLIPDSVIPSTITVDVENFTYDILENDVLHVNIDFSVEGEEQKTTEDNLEEEYPRATEPHASNTFDDYETDAEGNRIKQLNIFDEYQEQDELDTFLKSLQNLKNDNDNDESSSNSRLIGDDFNSTINNTLNSQDESDTFLYGTIAKDDIRKSPKIIDILPSEQKVSEDQDTINDELNDYNIRDNNLIQTTTNQENINIKINNYNDNDTSFNDNHIEQLDNQENTIPQTYDSPIKKMTQVETLKSKDKESEEMFKKDIKETTDIKEATEIQKTTEIQEKTEIQERTENQETTDNDKMTLDNLDINETSLEKQDSLKNDKKAENNREDKEENMSNETKDEYVTYHIHIVKAEETLETIVKNYSSSLDTISLYNDVKNIKPGDKLLIPEYLDE